MKAVLVEQIGSFAIREIDVPAIAPQEVLVRVQVTGLCRTDLKIVRVGHRDLVLPRVPGEEVVGVIEEVGAEVSRFRAGQRVYVYPELPAALVMPAEAAPAICALRCRSWVSTVTEVLPSTYARRRRL